MRTFFASALRISVAVLVAVAMYIAGSFVSVRSVGKQTSSAMADAIVVLGAAQYDGTPSPMLQARLEHALQLYNNGFAPIIAVTGGKQKADRFTEAATSRRWLEKNGVLSQNIIEESTGHSTWQSLSNVASVLRERGIQRVIISTSSWHVQRSVLTLRELGFTAIPSGAPTTSVDVVRELKETVGVSLGRIIGFRRLFSITG
jgi:uncharacterized SAM-binding protein YcdF (DUF218 family)